MALADPQSVTISGTAITLPRTGSGVGVGSFTKDDGNVELQISHAYGKRNRRLVKLNHRKVAADPLLAAQNLQYNASIHVVVDVPPVGYTPAELKAIWDGFVANLNAASGANILKVLGGES